MKRRTLVTTIIISIVVVAILIYSLASADESSKPLEGEVSFGKFEVVVSVTGELEALRSTDIKAPEALGSRELRFRELTISDLIPEGTIVNEGDYVATLDRSEADNEYKDLLDQLEVAESQYNSLMLDTTLQLRDLREELVNLKFNLEEAQITLEQSQFEPPATIRQAQINLDKAQRAYDQAQENYDIKVEQIKADILEARLDLTRTRRRANEMQSVLEKFVITAPASGMVIYARDWNGQKRVVGSSINTRDLTVATLPDMSEMLSKTYVNEIDISKVESGQQVRIGVDAFPEKKFTGVVTSVANVGEQLPNTDAKVFEVVIQLNESDPILRPAMTTSNFIVTKTFDNVMYVPLEAVHSTDSMTFVYTKNNTKQIVVVDEANDNEIIIEDGLNAGDIVLLSVPENAEDMKITGVELMARIKEKEAEEKRQEEQAQRELEEQYNGTFGPRTGAMPQGAEGFQNLSDEQRQEMMENFRQNMPEGFQNLSDEQRQELMRNRPAGSGQGQFGGRPGGTTQDQEEGDTPPTDN